MLWCGYRMSKYPEEDFPISHTRHGGKWSHASRTEALLLQGQGCAVGRGSLCMMANNAVLECLQCTFQYAADPVQVFYAGLQGATRSIKSRIPKFMIDFNGFGCV